MPTFDSATLPELTRERLPELAEDTGLQAQALARDGSDRSYYRLSRGDGSEAGIVVMHYGTERAENLAFAPITNLLESFGIACPRLHATDEQRHLLWLEDLGKEDLFLLADQPWATTRRPLYEKTLIEVAKLHALTSDRLATLDELPPFERPFDADLYQWEQDYFFDNFAPHFSAAPSEAVAAVRNDPALSELITRLAELPRSLVHRDFQSRNVLVQGDRIVLIDYQGMRLGRPEYDLASLLYDPYIPLEENHRQELFGFYSEHLAANHPEAPTPSHQTFLECAAQRLMQALGAYGFLGVVKQKRHFLASVPPAAQNLLSVIDHLPSLEPLRPVLNLKK